MPLPAGTRLGPYEIVSTIGAGGMGELYKALDTRLHRTVAIKVVSATAADDPVMRERLLREARAASALNHPHICTIHDVGDVDGHPFIAMEWMDGESLAERLSGRSAPMAVDELLRLAGQMADALDAAHARGIIHRDLKPANLFITRRGDAKILDFGLARMAHAADDDTRWGEPDLTQPGDVVGTVSYMSPEQARGLPLDARSDLFSLGVVLYEMATGRRAFAAATSALTFDAILNREPSPPSETNPAVPAALDAVIRRLLAKDRAGRIASAATLRAELESLREGGRGPRASESTRAAMPSVAVLPFANLSPDAENEYVADGITEDIISALAQLAGLQVAARTSSFAFKGQTPDMADVAAKLRVGHVVSGSVRRAGPMLRVTAQLVSTRDGFQIWSEKYDRPADDIFRIQDEIATAIAQKLRVALGGSSGEALVKQPTENLAAYDLYLKGRFFLNQRGAGVAKGRDCFEQAVALDGAFAQAHAGLASALALAGFWGYLPAYEAMPSARREALTALDLAPSLAEAYPPLMLVTHLYDWDAVRADRLFDTAIALDDRLTIAYLFHSLNLAAQRRFEESIAAATRAFEIDPLSATTHAILASSHLYAGQFEACEVIARRGMELGPTTWFGERARVTAVWMRTRSPDIIPAAEAMVELSQRHHWTMTDLALMYAGAGRLDGARSLAAEIEDRARRTYVPPLGVASLLAAADRADEAWAWVERAYRERDNLAAWKVWPLLPERLVRDDRLAAMLKRMGYSARGARSERV